MLLSVAAVAQAQPANDLFANRQALPGTSGTVNGSNTGATKETGEPNPAGSPATSSIWYSWRPTGSGQATFDTSGSAIDTVLGAYVGPSVSTLTEVSSNDDVNDQDLTSKITFRAQANTTYYIVVNSYAPSARPGTQGAITLNFSQQVDPTVRFTVSGTVKTNSTPVTTLGDVIVSLSGADSSNSGTSSSTLTSSTGTYSFPNMLAGNYILTATKSGYTFSPDSLKVTVTRDSTGNDFVATKLPDPVLPEMYVSDVAVREGDAGSPFVTFNVSMNQASKDPITVFFATSNGTASSTTDYKSTRGSFTFASGTTAMTVDVGLRPDTVVEADETFFFKISGAQGAKIVDDTGICTIVNDDAAPATSGSARSAKLPTRIRVAALGRKRI